MKILVVHNNYRSDQPSGEDQAVDQEVGLLEDAGHQVETFERHNDDISSMSTAQRAALPIRVTWNGRVRTELTDRLRQSRPDVVHVHNTFPLLSPSVLAACTDTRTPVVATLHNYRQICPVGTLYRDGHGCTACLGQPPLPALRHGCYRDSRFATVPMVLNTIVNRKRWWSGVSRFFCVSHAQRDLLRQGGVPTARLMVKYNFVPDTLLRRTSHGAHVLYLGRLAEEKGVRVLMAAWDMLTAHGEMGLPLVLGGTGPLAAEVERWSSQRANVRYMGSCDNQQCRELTAHATTVVAPSTWREPFGLVVVEAMAAGVPAVAAGHGAFTELVTNGVTGLLHRPGDVESLAEALRHMVSSARSNEQMGSAARLRYERDFTASVGLRALITGYNEAIDATAAATH